MAAAPASRTSRSTRQRQAILEQLRAVTTHPTANEVYEMVRRRLPHISLGTVYRNLELLVRSGEIQRVCLGSAQSRFDAAISPHYHVRCVRCGRVADLAMKPLRAIERAARRGGDYQVTGYRLEFVGQCPRCKRQRRDGASQR